MKKFTLNIPDDIEGQLSQCRASIQQVIRKRLQDIVEALPAPLQERKTAKTAKAVQVGPPFRFYVFEGYRVSYQVNPETRSVSVLRLQPESG